MRAGTEKEQIFPRSLVLSLALSHRRRSWPCQQARNCMNWMMTLADLQNHRQMVQE